MFENRKHLGGFLILEEKLEKSFVLCAKLLRRVRLCDPMDSSPPGSSVRGILQARKLEWVAMPSSKRSSQPRDRTSISYISCIGRHVLYH